MAMMMLRALRRQARAGLQRLLPTPPAAAACTDAAFADAPWPAGTGSPDLAALFPASPATLHHSARLHASTAHGRQDDSSSGSSTARAAAADGDKEQPGSGNKAAAGADAAAAQQRLQAYLRQQQQGIGSSAAAQLAGELAGRLAYANPGRQTPVDEALSALQFFVGRGMRPDKAVQLATAICKGSKGSHASFIRQWQTWEPTFAANWRLADGYLAAYQQRCTNTKQDPLKGSESLAVLLSDRPGKYPLLKVPDLQQKLAALQQGELNLEAADVGELIASGLDCNGSQETIAAVISWLVQFAGSIEAALSMLRQAAGLTNRSTVTLDNKVAALKAAWAGTLQPSQVEQLVQRFATVLTTGAARYADTAAVLRSWFPQPGELWAVLQQAPALIAANASSLTATERWMTGPPLGLSRQQFLQLVVERPQVFFRDMSAPLTQHKLAFLVQVGGVPLERALGEHSGYLKSSTEALAGRYFLLLEHGVPLPRHADGGVELSYSTFGLPRLLRLMRRHDGAGRLPADDREAEAYLRAWLRAWPETDSGRRWAKPPSTAS